MNARIIRTPLLLFALCLCALAATFIIRTEPMETQKSHSIGLAAAGYRNVFRNPRAPVCYGTVFLEGLFFYGILPFIAAIFAARGHGGAFEAGLVIGAVGVGGLAYIALVRRLLRHFSRPQFMAASGAIMAAGPFALCLGFGWQANAVA